MTAGYIFSKVCARGGLNVFTATEYPSLIRGGHNIYHVRVEERELTSPIVLVDLLVALNKETIDLHKGELTHGGAIVYDEGTKLEEGEVRPDVLLYPIPLQKYAREIGEAKVMMNAVALGASVALVDYDFDLLARVMRETFGGKKGEEIADANTKAARAGYDYIREHFQPAFGHRLKRVEALRRMLINGNEAMAIAAIRAGCKFFTAYPMTPISSLLQYMAANGRAYNIVVKQPEDEISVINTAAGASFAGARSMVATSGGGFSLMVEALGMIGGAEVPMVILEGQRPGPSTGMPTWTEQGDLKFVLSASQGEFPRVVIAPGDPAECFYTTMDAFNIADKYQLPVILVSDKYLAESARTMVPFDEKGIGIERGAIATEDVLAATKDYRRYRPTDSGVSLRSLPGQRGGEHVATGEEHDEYGNLEEDAENRKRQMEKRMRKLEYVARELPEPKVYGAGDSDITIVGWGSTKGPILEAMRYLEADGIRARFLHLVYLFPFPGAKVAQVLDSSRASFMVENNKTAQMAGVIREYTGRKVQHNILKYDGRSFYPHEIYDAVRRVLHGH